MHFRFVLKQLGLLLILLCGAMIFPVVWSVHDYIVAEPHTSGAAEVIWSFCCTICVGAAAGFSLILLGRGASGQQLGRKEALLLVALTWFVGAALSAMPFRMWAFLHDASPGQDPAFESYINCYFEAMSGLTTTGATVVQDIPSIPDSLLLWRAFTHWLGGLGIVVLFVAVLPFLGVGGKKLFRVESPGPSIEGPTPRIQETARRLWFIYLGLTVAEIVLLMLVGRDMTWLNAITHTFATLATGGFSTVNESVGGFGPAVQWVIIVFMCFAGVNFAIYNQVLRGKFKSALRNTELRAYVLLMLTASVVVGCSIYGASYELTTGMRVTSEDSATMRDAIFQVVSIQTTTGFCTANFDQWPVIAKGLLVTLMFVGGCGGSTGGGIKVVRIVVAVKVIWAELERVFRPSVVRPIRVGDNPVDHQQLLGIVAYVLCILLLAAIGAGLLVLTEGADGVDGMTAVTASVATLNNIGPGLGAVGAVENYAWFSDGSKLVMCLLMAVGRLEVFAVLVIFMPRFWRSE